MGVNHRGADVAVAEQFLHRANIVTVLQQVGREGVAQGMAPRMRGEPSLATGFFDCFLQDGFVEVMPTDLAGAGIGRELGGRKDKLPFPLLGAIGIFPFQGVR